MDPGEADILTLVERAQGLEDSRTKVQLLEEAVRLADHAGNTDLGFKVRLQLIRAAFGCGAADRMLIAITWCLARSDQDPERYSDPTLTWQCKHVLSYIASFPSVSRAQIDAIGGDITRRYETQGLSLRPILQFQMSNAFAMGYPELARECYERCWLYPLDTYCESEDWERFFQVQFLLSSQKFDEALAHAEPFFTGRLAQSDVSPFVRKMFMLPLLRLNRDREAMEMHKRAYPAAAKNPKWTGGVGEHMYFLALTRNFERGLDILQRHFRTAWEHPVPATRFWFFLRAWFLTESLMAEGIQTIPFRLPGQHPLAAADGQLETAALSAWCQQIVEPLAAAFNQRNGNLAFQRHLESTWANRGKLRDVPLE